MIPSALMKSARKQWEMSYEDFKTEIQRLRGMNTPCRAADIASSIYTKDVIKTLKALMLSGNSGVKLHYQMIFRECLESGHSPGSLARGLMTDSGIHPLDLCDLVLMCREVVYQDDVRSGQLLDSVLSVMLSAVDAYSK